MERSLVMNGEYWMPCAVSVFLTAWLGSADYLVSSNREFLRQAVVQQDLFRCVPPSEFLAVLSDL